MSYSQETTQFPSSYQLACQDIQEGVKGWRLWLLLSWQDIKMRYRRSTLGPFWVTLSMAITIYTMGLLYGKLLKMDLSVYYPFLASGMLTWNLISTLIIDGSNIFMESEGFLKQMKQPYSTFVFRVVGRCFIIFFHNLLALLPIVIFFHVKMGLALFLLPMALLVIWVNASTYTTILAILGTRFRDLPQLISSLIQVAFFMTPIMWSPSVLPEKYHFLIRVNPFAQFVEILREPLLGKMPSLYAIEFVGVATLVGLVVGFLFFTRFRRRIVYWL